MVYIKKPGGRKVWSLDCVTPETVQRLSPICKALKASILTIDSKQNLSEDLLATITCQLLNHYQTHYGKSAAKPSPFTIPPSKFFNSFEVDGSLHVILSSLLVGATVRELSPWDRLFEQSVDTLLPILHDIDKALAVVFLNSVPVGLITRLSRLVLAHGGQLVSSEDIATHVVDWNEDIDAGDNSVDDLVPRAVDITQPALASTRSILIHWVHQPDSANVWMDEENVTMSLAEEQQALQGRRDKARHYVSCRFLLDTDLHNEWMYEADYENLNIVSASALDEDGLEAAAAPVTRKGQKSKGKRQSSSSLKSLSNKDKDNNNNNHNNNSNNAGPISGTTALYEKLFADILPPSVTQQVWSGELQRVLEVDGATTSITSSNTSSAEAKSSEDSGKANSNSSSSSSNKRRRTGDVTSSPDNSSNNNNNNSNNNSLTLKPREISVLEHRLLEPAVLQDEASYLTLRNGILQLYALRPEEYLSATECRRRLAGDVARVSRVHEFLDAFGAINHSLSPALGTTRPGALTHPAAVSADREQLQLLRSRSRRSVAQRVSRLPGTAQRLTSDAQSLDRRATREWTSAMDALLQEHVRRCGADWNEVARGMQQQHAQEQHEVLSPLLCMLRFMELQLPFPASQTNTDSGVSGVSGTMVMTQPQRLHTALQLLHRLAALLEDWPATSSSTSEVVGEVEVEVADDDDNAMHVDDDTNAHTHTHTTVVREGVRLLQEALRRCVRRTTEEVRRSGDALAEQWLRGRLEQLEDKVRRFQQLEAQLGRERSQLESDRRDASFLRLLCGASSSSASASTSGVQGGGAGNGVGALGGQQSGNTSSANLQALLF